VEVYSAALARALVAAGQVCEVFAPRPDGTRPALSQTRELRGGHGITWLALDPRQEEEQQRRAPRGAASAFARFLEREQPDLVHFQHWLHLGPELVDVARERGLPTLFTAHDHYAVSDEYTLLAPDLTPFDATDFEAMARCRLARGAMDNALPAHDGSLVPGAPAGELAERVHAILHGEVEDPAALAGLARALRRKSHPRLQTLARVDHVESPTRYLAQVLERAGLEREVTVRALGIEREALARVEPPRSGGGPLRVLYLGGYYEHKGVHVLLDACAGLEQRVQLVLRGCAGTSAYLAGLRERAAVSGADLGGPFERAELPRLLEASDLVVVPSLWSENAPFVIREAFAAGRPVIASDTPALRESVRQGVDGLLVAAGDVRALGSALAECAGDGERLATLVAGVRPPRSICEDAAELIEIYSRLAGEACTARARRRGQLPEHLHGFAQRHEELAALPTSALFERAARGLEQLFTAEGLEPTPASGLIALFEGGEGLRERLAEAARAIEWRRSVTHDRARALAAAQGHLEQAQRAHRDQLERADWLADLLQERERRLVWREQTVQALERSVACLRAELGQAEQALEEFAGRTSARERELALLLRERDWLARERRVQTEAAQWQADQCRARETELTWIREQGAGRAAQVAELEKRLADAQATLADAGWRLEQERLRAVESEQDLKEVRERLARAQERADGLQPDLDQARDHLARASRAHGQLAAEREAARSHQEFLEQELDASRAGELSAQAQLAQLRDEMRAAAEEGAGLGPRLFAAPLAKRLARWQASLDAIQPPDQERP